MLKGYRTYAASAGIVLAAVGGFLSGDTTVLEAVTLALTGLGFAGLRAAK